MIDLSFVDKAAETQEDWRLTVSGRFAIMIDVKFEWTFPDSVIFLPHSYLVIVVWLFLLPVSRKCWQNGGLYQYGKWFFISYQDAPQRTAYQAEPVSAEALNAVLEAGTYAPTGSGRQFSTIIAITAPYYGAPVVVLILANGSASTFVEDGSCRKPCAASGRLHWVIQPRKPVNPQHANKTILFGFNVLLSGAIFLCRILCREEGKYADQQ